MIRVYRSVIDQTSPSVMAEELIAALRTELPSTTSSTSHVSTINEQITLSESDAINLAMAGALLALVNEIREVTS